MKKLLYLLLLFLTPSVFIAQTHVYFDKNMRKLDSSKKDKARYIAYKATEAGDVSTVFRIENGFSHYFAEGVLYSNNTLMFDGKVNYLGESKKLIGVRFFKNGVPEPIIPVNKYLKKDVRPFTHYLVSGENGEFCAYRLTSPIPDYEQDKMYATGKIVDTFSMMLTDTVTYFDSKGDIDDLKIFNNGKEIPFIATTGDLKEEYDILGIQTYTYSGDNSFWSTTTTPLTYDADDVEKHMKFFILKCKLMGADAAVGIKTSITNAQRDDIRDDIGATMLIQGTAVRLKNKKTD